MTSRQSVVRIPAFRKVLFAALTVVVFFVLVEIVLAVLGVRPVLVDEDPYVGFSSHLDLYVPTAGGARLETAANKLALFNRQVFPRAKPPNAFRVFAVGGSTTYGRPFADETSFSAWIREYLGAAAPDRTWEVINAGGISYASYRVANLMEELVAYEPDLFVIYCGNNEFLEKRTYGEVTAEHPALSRTRILLEHSRLWALGRRIADARRRRAEQRYELEGEVRGLLDSSAGLDYYHRDDAFTARVLDHYRFNLRRMVRLATAAGAGVVVVTVPVNEKDFAPFKSEHGGAIAATERAECARLLERAAAALDTVDAEAAAGLAEAAVGIDPRHADAHYIQGRALYSLGRVDRAASCFERAIAEDVCPLRALPEIQQAILDLADDGVPVVDFRGELKRRNVGLAGHPLLGDEHFLDHVHPKIEVNGLIAQAIIDGLRGAGIIDLDAEWHDRVGERVQSEILSRVGAEAHARAYKNLSKVLIWAGKQREAQKYVAQAEAVLGGDWELRLNAGIIKLDTGDIAGAMDDFRAAIHFKPEAAPAYDRLAAACSALGDLDCAVEMGRMAVTLDPGMAPAWNNLGESCRLRGESDQALTATRRALELDPDLAEAHNNLGNIHFDRGDLDQALSGYHRAISLRPGFAEAITNRGLVLAQRGRYGEALSELDRAIDLDPKLVAAHLGRGRALLATGRFGEAIPELAMVAEHDPGLVEAWEHLARCLMTVGRREEAGAAIQRGIAVNPRAAGLHRLAGTIAAAAGRFAEAAASLATAVEIEPGLVQGWVDLAQVRLEQGRVRAALDVLEDALRRHPDSDMVHHRLAVARLASGLVPEGVASLERALRLNPENAAACLDLAIVCEHLGDSGRARELYTRAARLDPSLTAAREGAARVVQGR